MMLVTDTCPHCARNISDPEVTPAEDNGAWHCTWCGLYRVPAAGSAMERERDEVVDLIEKTAPDMTAAWGRSQMRLITAPAGEVA